MNNKLIIGHERLMEEYVKMNNKERSPRKEKKKPKKQKRGAIMHDWDILLERFNN